MTTDSSMALHGGTGIERQSFGSHELERRGEATPTSLASTAMAEVQSRYVMALQRPRSAYDARARMLAECKRPSFAGVAIFRKPIGQDKSVEGLSIRFAEVAARAWGNLHVGREVISDEPTKRIVRVHVTDLEANLTESLDLVLEKTVERKSLRQGQIPRGRRTNSFGDLVYIVDGSEGELLTKQRAEEAKAKRTCVLAMIPGDILDECERQIYETQRAADARDPEGAKKHLFDSFAALGVRPSDLEAYVGHPLDTLSPAELVDLRGVYAGLNDGVVTWPEALYARTGTSGEKSDTKAQQTTQKLKAHLEKKTAAKKAAEASQKPASPSQPASNPDRHASVADSAGTTPEIVAAIERFAADGDSVAAIKGALATQGMIVGAETIERVLADLRRG